jgi:two-component system, sensor histidine kinase and response regulator
MTRILIIEDETILREEIIEWLTLEGYEVFGAADGVHGVKQALQQQPDLIISDITMPRLDGHGVLLELHANPSTTTIPFIFMTARSTHEDIRKGMGLGADDYITKPFTRLELLDAIKSRLDKKTAVEKQHQTQANQLQTALQEEREHRLLTTRLVAMFSHDFRTPLATIRASNSMLRDYGQRMDAERQKTHFNRVEASVSQLLQMLDDMLVVAQMETGNLEFQPEWLNLEQFVQGIIGEFQTIHSETHTFIYNSQCHDDIAFDPRLLRQIAANLIGNAVKYSPKGSTIFVALRHAKDSIELEVQDQGIGIPEAEQQHIFEAFHRASNAANIGGTGLGLAIVQQAIQLHSGTIHLQSQIDMGTTITVRIPIE